MVDGRERTKRPSADDVVELTSSFSPGDSTNKISGFEGRLSRDKTSVDPIAGRRRGAR